MRATVYGRLPPALVAFALLHAAACGGSAPAVSPAPRPNPTQSTPPQHAVEAGDSDSKQQALAPAQPDSKECLNRERAIQTANEGDRSVKTNLDRAIDLYKAAVTLDPVNHFLYWKLGLAYERRADWSRAASIYMRAASIAPQYAHYWARAGYAQWILGEQNEPDAHASAQLPLTRCMQTDPGFSECHFWLGRVAARLGNDAVAIVHLTRAIELDPQSGEYYPALVAAYSRLGKPDFALAVAKEGTRFVAANLRNAPALYTLAHFIAAAARKRGDKSEALSAEKDAQAFADAAHLDLQHFDLECGCPQTPVVLARSAHGSPSPSPNAPPAAIPTSGAWLTGYAGYDPACPLQGGAYEPRMPYSGPGVNLPAPSQ